MLRTCIIAFTFLLFFTSYELKAQNRFFKDDPHVFYGGLCLGMNIAQVDGDGYGGYNKAGLNVGACVYAQFSPAIGISMELLYSQKGSRAVNESYSYALGPYLQKYYLDLNYVEVPLMFNFFTDHRLHCSIGASYGRLLKSKEEMLTDVSGAFIDQDKYYFNKNDINGIAGLSYQLYKSLFVSIRYQHSINTIREANRAVVGWGVDEYNHTLALRLIYLVGSGNSN